MENGKMNFVMGLTAGIAVISTLGFFVLLGDKVMNSEGSSDTTDQVAGTQQANAAPDTVQAPPAATADISKIAPVSDSDHIRGNKNAKITMIEYSDFECPFCQRHAPTLQQVIDQYEGDVRLVYRHLPLSSIHPNAQKAAEASECAADQGKFWEMHDKLFENNTALGVTNLKSYAKDLGLNQSKFDDCLDSGKYAAKVNQQAAEAQAAGITGTPGTFVNDQLVKGAYPLSTFQQIIDAEL